MDKIKAKEIIVPRMFEKLEMSLTEDVENFADHLSNIAEECYEQGYRDGYKKASKKCLLGVKE